MRPALQHLQEQEQEQELELAPVQVRALVLVREPDLVQVLEPVLLCHRRLVVQVLALALEPAQARVLELASVQGLAPELVAHTFHHQASQAREQVLE